MTTRSAWLLLGLAQPVAAQSLIFPSFFDRHIPHLITKPVVSLGVYGAARLVHASPTVATIAALAGPELFSIVRTHIIYGDGHLPWQDAAAWHDVLADTCAASLSLILLRLRGWTRVLATALWGGVEFGLGLHHWAVP